MEKPIFFNFVNLFTFCPRFFEETNFYFSLGPESFGFAFSEEFSILGPFTLQIDISKRTILHFSVKLGLNAIQLQQGTNYNEVLLFFY